MVHKPNHRVHSFRGLLADGGQDEINLERSNVNLAYRIVKFQVINRNVGATAAESAVKIWKESQSSIDNIVDFGNPDLLGAAYYQDSTSSAEASSVDIIFGNKIFSRNIYVTSAGTVQTADMNYYIELEEVPVSAATLMQLKLGVARKLNLSESAPDA
ncbi:unnamed protein product [marine sediment metagenome]|uniref:Uncharacterized protein n=1 Tax=marine sediment metagenome TaxID=412755 RepID=X1CN41_9ZZZZ